MKIKFITPELHAELKALAEQYPDLVFENVGYEYIGRAKREAHTVQIARIEEILREHITGFSRFFNFCRRKEGALSLRFDYNWGAADDTRSFIGVGYLPLDWLRDGFPEHATLP